MGVMTGSARKWITLTTGLFIEEFTTPKKNHTIKINIYSFFPINFLIKKNKNVIILF